MNTYNYMYLPPYSPYCDKQDFESKLRHWGGRVGEPLCYPKQKWIIYETPMERLYRAAFPEDPIREWSEKKIAEIEAKYAWLRN